MYHPRLNTITMFPVCRPVLSVLLKVMHFILIVRIAVGQVLDIAKPQSSIEAEDECIAHLRAFIPVMGVSQLLYFRRGKHSLVRLPG